MGEETAERTTWERCASLQVPPSSFCPSLLWQRYKVIECPVSGTTGEIFPYWYPMGGPPPGGSYSVCKPGPWPGTKNVS